ncbi:hypothetical protein AYI68_g2381 [Smittium mucronatum]|uniref:Uncharacterized protein n=1 Tax=Smittium mucronatum TaxID=133383 RepID=A0A1R0H2Y0_9FUNG|nr:hypothetical protein AYI68_g2381 [Smittium mucronatum]
MEDSTVSKETEFSNDSEQSKNLIVQEKILRVDSSPSKELIIPNKDKNLQLRRRLEVPETPAPHSLKVLEEDVFISKIDQIVQKSFFPELAQARDKSFFPLSSEQSALQFGN